MQKITVLGAGAFGTAMAQLLATNGHQVTLWCYEPEVQETIAATHINARYLPNIKLHKNITATTALQEACAPPIIFVAIPVKYLRSILEQIAPWVTKEHQWVILSKGIEQETGLLPSDILQNVLPIRMIPHIAVLSGPSYAQEIAQQQLTLVAIAAKSDIFASTVQKLVSNTYFVAEIYEDFMGIQLCAAYKNVAALCLGMLEGAGYGENTKAFALMRCFDEMHTLIGLYGSRLQSVNSPAGLGDLVLTSYGKQSRNHLVGMKIGKGESLDHILNSVDGVPESINSVASFHQLAEINDTPLQICSAIHGIIFNKKSIADLITAIKHYEY